MSHVTNDPNHTKHLTDATAFAKREIERRFPLWNQQQINAEIPKGKNWGDYTLEVEYYQLLRAFTDENSDPLALLKQELHDEKEATERLELIIDSTRHLDQLCDYFKGAEILRLFLYPELALLLLNDPDISKTRKNLTALDTPHPCGDETNYSVYDFCQAIEIEMERCSEKVAIYKCKMDTDTTTIKEETFEELVERAKQLASNHDTGYLPALKCLWKGQQKKRSKKKMARLKKAIVENIGETRKTALLQELGLQVPTRARLTNLLNIGDTDQLCNEFSREKPPRKVADLFDELVMLLINQEEFDKIWGLRESNYWKPEYDVQLAVEAAKRRDAAVLMTKRLVTEQPSKWRALLLKLWIQSVHSGNLNQTQAMANTLIECLEPSKRQNTLGPLVAAHAQKTRGKSQEWRDLTNGLIPVTAPKTDKLGKQANKIGKSSKKKRKKKKRVEDPFRQVKVQTGINFQDLDKLPLKKIPTKDWCLIGVPVNRDNDKAFLDLLRLCKNDPARRAKALQAVAPYLDKKLSAQLAGAIGELLLRLDHGKFQHFENLANKIASTLQDEGLEKTFQWKMKPNLQDLPQVTPFVEHSAFSSECADLLYNYVKQQLKKAKNGQVERLAVAVDPLPQTEIDWTLLTIEIWSRTGQAQWVKKAVALWDSQKPQVKQRSITMVLRGIVASDNPKHREDWLLTVMQSPQFRALENRATLIRELITKLLEQSDIASVRLSSTILELLPKQTNETDTDTYLEAATEVFEAIGNIEDVKQRLACAQTFMLQIQVRLNDKSPKEWHSTHFGWLSHETDLATFTETLRYMPLLDSLLEPMEKLYDEFVSHHSAIEYRLLLAARLLVMDKKRLELGLGAEYDAVLADCVFMDVINSTPANKLLSYEWKGPVENYEGPAKTLKQQLETTIGARLITRKLTGSEKPNLEEVLSEMLGLLDRMKAPEPQVLIAFNTLCLAFIKENPEEKAIEQIKCLFQAVHNAKAHNGKPDTIVLTCSKLMQALQATNPKIIHQMWEMIVRYSDLTPDYLLLMVKDWMSRLKPENSEELAKVFIVTSQEAAKIKEARQSENLAEVAVALWKNAVRDHKILTPDQACAWFLSGAKIIIEKNGALPKGFFHTAYLTSEKYEGIENSPVAAFLEELKIMVGYQPIPGFDWVLGKEGFVSIEGIEHPLYPLRCQMRNGLVPTKKQLENYSDEEIAHHLLLPLLINSDEKADGALLELIFLRIETLKHFPKDYLERPWRQKIYRALGTLVSFGPAVIDHAVDAFELPEEPSSSDLMLLQTFHSVALDTLCSYCTGSMLQRMQKTLINLAHLGEGHWNGNAKKRLRNLFKRAGVKDEVIKERAD